MVRIFLRAIRYRFWKLIRIRATPHSVALGLAIGVFCGALPIMGIQSLFAVPLALLFRCSVAASLIGVWWTNPVTFIPIYYAEYCLGGALFNESFLTYRDFYHRFSKIENLEGVMALGGDVMRPLIYGSLVAGVVLSVSSYFCMLWILERRRRRKAMKRLLNSNQS